MFASVWKSCPITLTIVPVAPELGVRFMDGLVAEKPKSTVNKIGKIMRMPNNRDIRILVGNFLNTLILACISPSPRYC